MDDTITIFVNGDSYEISPDCSVADLRERAGCSDGDAHVRGEDREYVLPNDTALHEYVETGAQVSFVSASG